MATEVTLIPGDGIGPSITDATVRILEAAGADLSYDRQLAGMSALSRWHDPMPEATLDSIKRTKLALKGPLETPVGEGYRSVNVVAPNVGVVLELDPRTGERSELVEIHN